MTRVIDVSLPLSDRLTAFPGNPALLLRPILRRVRGDATNVSELRIGTHAGTHVDPPAHLVDGGPGVEALPLDELIGEAMVADCTAVPRVIGARDLEALGLPRGLRRLLLRTRNSAFWRDPTPDYPTDYVALAHDGALWLIRNGVRLVGIDGLSIEPYETPGRPTHTALLGAGVVIVEGLDLDAVQAGPYTLVCLPLRLVGADGGPARVVLLGADHDDPALEGPAKGPVGRVRAERRRERSGGY